MATFSVVSGIKVGIRRLSEICFGIGKAISNRLVVERTKDENIWLARSIGRLEIYRCRIIF